MPLDVKQFSEYVVEPTLQHLSPEIPYSNGAVMLVLGTAIQESGLRYLDQLTPGPGPAVGLFQMQIETFWDHWRAITRWPKLHDLVCALRAPSPEPFEQMRTNLAFAAAMCRVHYWFRDPNPMPQDLAGAARSWKRWYNTAAGDGTETQFINNYRMHTGKRDA